MLSGFFPTRQGKLSLEAEGEQPPTQWEYADELREESVFHIISVTTQVATSRRVHRNNLLYETAIPLGGEGRWEKCFFPWRQNCTQMRTWAHDD